jgi:SAM-dependent methyltransferase
MNSAPRAGIQLARKKQILIFNLDPGRAEREQKAYDEEGVWHRSHAWHYRFRHVFESPNTQRYEKLFFEVIRENSFQKQVLEIGCGDGIVAERISKYGAAYIMGIDLSKEFIADAKPREVPERLEFVQGNASDPIGKKFDLVFGRSILHHIDYRMTLAMLYNDNLNPGGLMIFMEPLGSNPIIKFYHLISNVHTPDEKSFERADLRWLGENFVGFAMYPINLISFPLALVSTFFFSTADNALLRLSDKLDVWISARFRFLTPYFRHSILIIRKST